MSTVPPQRTPDAVAADAVVVRLGASRYVVDLADVAEVGKVPSLTRVPGLPAWVAGVANWRGRILPVLDLHSLLGAEPADLCPQSRLAVLSTHAATVGVLVDAVESTTNIGGDVAPCPIALTGLGAGLLAGQATTPDGPAAVLDVGAVIALRGALPQVHRTA